MVAFTLPPAVPLGSTSNSLSRVSHVLINRGHSTPIPITAVVPHEEHPHAYFPGQCLLCKYIFNYQQLAYDWMYM